VKTVYMDRLSEKLLNLKCTHNISTEKMAWPKAYLGNPFYTNLRKGDSHLKYNSLTFTILCLSLTHALSPSHTCPWPLCGSLHSTTPFCTLTHPYPVNHSPNGSCYFQAKTFPLSLLIHSSFYSNIIPAYKDGTVLKNVGI
jgi:hypothetical protein